VENHRAADSNGVLTLARVRVAWDRTTRARRFKDAKEAFIDALAAFTDYRSRETAHRA
jgi:hypothetical protein